MLCFNQFSSKTYIDLSNYYKHNSSNKVILDCAYAVPMTGQHPEYSVKGTITTLFCLTYYFSYNGLGST